MFKRRTSKVRNRRQVKVLQAHVMSPRIFWCDLMRLCGRMLKLAFILILIAAAGWGIWKGARYGLIENDEFRLRTLDLNPNPALDEIRLLELTGIDLTGSLFDCDAGEIEATLKALPELTGARVRREFPGTLKVEVTAREPWLWVSSPLQGVLPRDRKRGLLVDRAGFAFPCQRGMFEQARGLPVIELSSGGESLRAGQVVRHDNYLRGIRLFAAALDATPEAASWIDHIRQPKPWACEVTTRDGIAATFGHEDLERQMDDFLAAVDHARRKGERIATIQLIGKRSMPVTFHETAPPRAMVVDEPAVGPAGSRSSSGSHDPPPARGGSNARDRDLRELLER